MNPGNNTYEGFAYRLDTLDQSYRALLDRNYDHPEAKLDITSTRTREYESIIADVADAFYCDGTLTQEQFEELVHDLLMKIHESKRYTCALFTQVYPDLAEKMRQA